MTNGTTKATTRLVSGIGFGALVALAAWPASADPQGTVHRFAPGGTIRSSEINENFEMMRRGSDDLEARIGSPAALMTNDRTNLVAAINELVQRPSGVGPQGPPSTGALRMRGHFEVHDNQSAGDVLADCKIKDTSSTGGMNPDGREIAGQPFTMHLGGQLILGSGAAAPLVAGDVVARLEWVFDSAVGQQTVAQADPVTLTLDSSAAASITATGTVPAMPDFGNGVTEGGSCWVRLILESKSLSVGRATLDGTMQLAITPAD
jgi:hypothetical protein